jgi:ribose transport system ATP-binding protein
MSEKNVLALQGISKSFPGVKALKDVSFSLAAGEIRALVGENGAGKSTLMKILSGAYTANAGTISVFGETIEHPSPATMIGKGVAVIYQEMAQAPHLSVAENVLLGRLPRRAGGLVDWPEARRQTAAVLARLGFDIDPRARIDTLSVAKRQMVEIARALTRNARIIVLDEPSAVLAASEIAQLFAIIRKLSAEDGVAFVYISHRLVEVFDIAETVTVMRDGEVVHQCRTDEIDSETLIRHMVGREVGDIFPKRVPKIGAEALRVSGLSAGGLVQDASLYVRRGEIVGLFGLAGAGRTETLKALFGADRAARGTLTLDGKAIHLASPRDGLANGLGLVPEDRKVAGLFLKQSVGFNITISSMRHLVTGPLLSRVKENAIVDTIIRRLRVKTPNAHAAVQNLSGGNQQKCVIGRLVGAECSIILADEPTRGVDVGAKREIYDLLFELSDSRQLAILIASSELPEILNLCDRVYVMREGRITAELDARRTSEEEVMRYATHN